MSPVASKPESYGTARNAELKNGMRSPFEMLGQSELLLWPYRSLSKTMLHAHHNTAALVQINRQLADELREIVRRQQDFAVSFSEKFLHGVSNRTAGSERMRPSAESMDKLFETAIAGVREFGQAVAEAQVHSIEAFREHARKAAR